MEKPVIHALLPLWSSTRHKPLKIKARQRLKHSFNFTGEKRLERVSPAVVLAFSTEDLLRAASSWNEKLVTCTERQQEGTQGSIHKTCDYGLNPAAASLLATPQSEISQFPSWAWCSGERGDMGSPVQQQQLLLYHGEQGPVITVRVGQVFTALVACG